MELRPLGIDSGGVQEDFYFDPVTQTFGVKRTYSMDEWETIHNNQRLQNDNYSGYSGDKDKSFKHVASIPMAVVEMWEKIYGVNPLDKGNEALLTRLLNDKDWFWLRTSRGQVKIKER
jgi:hypothetical protein